MSSKLLKQSGVVSLMMTMVMMVVITLLVLGFADVARNEQRGALDDTLSAQAYYAAESGINDVRAVMNATIAAGNTVQDKTNCSAQGNYTASPVVDAAHNASYSCVLVNASPSVLNYTVGSTSTVVPLVSSGPNFGTLALAWKVGAGYAATASGCYTNLANLNSLPVANGSGAWGCNYPVLQVDVLDAGGGLARSNWNAKTSTFFLVPFNSASVANTAVLGAHGTAIPARCDATSCQVQLTGLAGTQYEMRLTALYRTNSPLSISASGGAKFVGAQATIDSTGKAQDVLRRVVVAVDLTDANAARVPSGALISQDSVCKRFGITSGSFNVYDDMTSGGVGNALCSLQSVGTPNP